MVIIINGKGGCGKDTLIESLGNRISSTISRGTYTHAVFNRSAVDQIKEIARYGGWNDDKSNEGRKLLHDLKMAFVAYNDLPSKDLFIRATHLHDTIFTPIVFLHIREPEEIQKMIDMLKRHQTPVTTLLVRRDATDEKQYGNHADDDVENFNYEYVFDNNTNLDVSKENFRKLITGIMTSWLEKHFNKSTNNK